MEQDDETVRALVQRAHRALEDVSRVGSGCPADTDRFDWSADLLDDLARVALGIGSAATTIADGSDDEVERLAHALATAIVRRRNEALVPLRRRDPRLARRA